MEILIWKTDHIDGPAFGRETNQMLIKKNSSHGIGHLRDTPHCKVFENMWMY